MKRIFPSAVTNSQLPEEKCWNCCASRNHSEGSISSGDRTKECDASDKGTSSAVFHDYCENSTVHGIKYIGEPRPTGWDRWWWILSFLISIILCTFLIRNLWIKWDETPVFVSFSEHSTHVWEIPFPAGK